MTIAARRNSEGQFSGNSAQKDCREHYKGSMVANHRGGSESLVVVTTLLFLTTSTSVTCRRQFVDVPAGYDVTDFRCPMCTSAKPYRKLLFWARSGGTLTLDMLICKQPLNVIIAP